MAQVTIAAGSSATVALAAGQRIAMRGTGTAQAQPLANTGRSYPIQPVVSSGSSIGAFSEALNVFIVATSAAVVYEVRSPGDVLAEDGSVAIPADEVGSIGSGGSGGWGTDRTAGVFELDEQTGEYFPTDETLDALPWLVGRDLKGREILRTWSAAGLSRTVDYSGGGGVATGNFVINGGEIWIPLSSSMPAIKTALAALGTSILGAPRFHVADLGLSVEWNRADACFRGVGKAEIHFGSAIDAGNYTSLSESGNLVAFTFPGWLSGPFGSWSLEADVRKTGTAQAFSVRIYAGAEWIAEAASISSTNLNYRLNGYIKNRGTLATNHYLRTQIGPGPQGGSSAWVDSTLNTASDVAFGVRMLNLVATGDTLGVKHAVLRYSHR